MRLKLATCSRVGAGRAELPEVFYVGINETFYNLLPGSLRSSQTFPKLARKRTGANGRRLTAGG